MTKDHRIICGDAALALSTMPGDSVDLIVTSPPYFRHKDYGVDGQIGKEKTIEEYVDKIRSVLEGLFWVTAKMARVFLSSATRIETKICSSCPIVLPLLPAILAGRSATT